MVSSTAAEEAANWTSTTEEGLTPWEKDIIKKIKCAHKFSSVQYYLEHATKAALEVQKVLLRIALKDWCYKHISKFDPRPMQLEAVRRLFYEKKDLVLVAKMLFGKSISIQAMLALRHNIIMIMIIPLNKVGEQ